MAAAPQEVLPARGMTSGDIENDAVVSRHMVLLDAIIAWSIANPGKPWSQCAAALKFSAPFVYKVVSTDSFRARYQHKSGLILEETGIASLRDKINAAANMAIERLIEKIPGTESVGELRETADVLLDRIYGPVGAGAGQTPSGPTTVVVPITAIIHQERDRLLAGKPSTSALPIVDATQLSETEAAPAVRDSGGNGADASLPSGVAAVPASPPLP